MTDLRVGIIGVNAERGWAAEAHVPAVRATAGLVLAAVATRQQSSADAAAAAFGVERAYGAALDLIHDPSIDVVTVASTVPSHGDLLHAAIAAGKHVLTEWPVTTSTPETLELAKAAARVGVQSAVGLQARANPAVLAAAEILSGGSLGRVHIVRVLSTTAGFGRLIASNNVDLEDPATGMNLTTIQAAHTLDLALHLVGAFRSLSSLSTIRFPEVLVGEDRVPFQRVLPDHVLMHGRLDDGGALTVEVIGGRPADDVPFRFEIEADAGVLVLTGGAPRGFQSGRLTLSVNGQAIPVRERALPAPAVNVAGIYEALVTDITTGRNTAPSFFNAASLSGLMDGIIESASAEHRTRE